MNQNSVLCKFISENEDWERKLTEDYGITVKKEPPLAIFNYGISADFHSPIVQEARGIIIDTDKLEVVCWPFRKFGNYNEDYADEIDWNSARVQDKIDGSIMKLWWNPHNQDWQLSTNSVIDASAAVADSLTGDTFADLFYRAVNFNSIKRDKLCYGITYIFELVSPMTQVVIRYPETKVYHIGTRCNVSGNECDADIGVEKPKEYPLHSLNDCVNAAAILNQSQDGAIHSVKKEGFVVVDRYWNRLKVKSPDYLVLHRMSSNNNFSKERIIQMIREQSINIHDVCEDFPNYAHYFKYYDFKVAELEYQAKVFCDLTDRIYEEYSHERKAVANVIKKHRLAGIGFQHLDTGKSAADLLVEMPLNRYCRLIPDYKPEKLSELFYQN